VGILTKEILYRRGKGELVLGKLVKKAYTGRTAQKRLL
jgi:hypothetical protein